MFHETGGDLGAHAASLRAFFDDDDAPRFFYRRADCFVSNGRQAAHINHLGLDTLAGKLSSGSLRVVRHQQPAENGHVLAFAPNDRPVQGHDIIHLREFNCRHPPPPPPPPPPPFPARAPFDPYSSLCSKISTGLSSRTAAFRIPFAS